MSENPPPGWIIASSTRTQKYFAVQLIHEALRDHLPTPSLADVPGWVRGTGGTYEEALQDAVRRAALNPPRGLS